MGAIRIGAANCWGMGMDEAQAVMAGVVVIIAIMLLAAATGNGNNAENDGARINISGKDLPMVPQMPALPQIKPPNASIEIPFIARHEIQGNISIDDVQFTALDGVKISGTAYLPANSKPESVAVLVHQLGMDRKTYRELAPKLAQNGIAVMAIDLRGHGGSPYKGGYSSFSTEDWLSAKKDIDAGIDALYDMVGDSSLPANVVGASIGANIALQYAADGKKTVAKVALLSPGLDFRGVTSEEAAKKYNGKVLALSSEEDLYAFDSVQTLQVENPAIEVANYTGLGHGTEMLKSPEVVEKLISFLSG